MTKFPQSEFLFMLFRHTSLSLHAWRPIILRMTLVRYIFNHLMWKQNYPYGNTSPRNVSTGIKLGERMRHFKEIDASLAGLQIGNHEIEV